MCMDYPPSDLVFVLNTIEIEIAIVVWLCPEIINFVHAAALSEKSARHRDASMCIVLSV